MANYIKLANCLDDREEKILIIANKTKRNYVNLGCVRQECIHDENTNIIDCVHHFMCRYRIWDTTDEVIRTHKPKTFRANPRQYHNISFVLTFYEMACISREAKQSKVVEVDVNDGSSEVDVKEDSSTENDENVKDDSASDHNDSLGNDSGSKKVDDFLHKEEKKHLLPGKKSNVVLHKLINPNMKKKNPSESEEVSSSQESEEVSSSQESEDPEESYSISENDLIDSIENISEGGKMDPKQSKILEELEKLNDVSSSVSSSEDVVLVSKKKKPIKKKPIKKKAPAKKKAMPKKKKVTKKKEIKSEEEYSSYVNSSDIVSEEDSNSPTSGSDFSDDSFSDSPVPPKRRTRKPAKVKSPSKRNAPRKTVKKRRGRPPKKKTPAKTTKRRARKK